MRDPKSTPLPWLCALQGAASGLSALSACQTQAAPTPQDSVADARAQASASRPAASTGLMHNIAKEIGDARCDTDSQCHSLGVGAKPCGGPEAYLSWSDKVSSFVRLSELATRHQAVRRLENERSGMNSDCRITRDPGAVCRPRASDAKRVCQPGQSSLGNAV